LSPEARDSTARKQAWVVSPWEWHVCQVERAPGGTRSPDCSEAARLSANPEAYLRRRRGRCQAPRGTRFPKAVASPKARTATLARDLEEH